MFQPMRFTYCLLGLSLLNSLWLPAQTITIQPYLQDAEPESIHILWETDTTSESTLHWGLTPMLGQSSSGINYLTANNTIVHEVALENLTRFTTYYYSVQTGAAISDTFSFKTPPFANAAQDFRLVAMSDMQKDQRHPDKFREIVEEGVMEYLRNNYGESLIDELALVMIPGDLVDNGNSYQEWKDDFFGPGASIFNQVPVYPVLGNHENNASYYFSYFKLPENGSEGFEEHWWYKDYGNLRIIGLNSNAPFATAEQLAWLDQVLEQSCETDSIDFVFAQLHHPHKSELWTPGESGFTGEVITRMENFSTTCGKPSIHFFGHTHGYSRGQSRDHKHLWINVATAGGAIDNWGEFPNFDYEEFSVSQDEYGFVVVDVTGGEEPSIHIRRISRGDQDQTTSNRVTDSLTVRAKERAVERPTPLYPTQNIQLIPECVTLQASSFPMTDSTSVHAQSHWQVTTLDNGFNEPVYEAWRQHENWYNEINTQAEDDLTDEKVTALAPHSNYFWRVRYRDQELNWSDWSSPAAFTTGASAISANLLRNGDAENGLANWDLREGVMESLEAEACNGIQPYQGSHYFSVGGLCEHSDFARAIQHVDLSTYTTAIDSNSLAVFFGGYLSNYSGDDLPEISVYFLDENGLTLGQSDTLSSLTNVWTEVSSWNAIPAFTRSLVMELRGTRRAGTDNDSYFDALFVQIGTGPVDCEVVTQTHAPAPLIPELRISPNPMGNYCKLELTEGMESEVQLQMVDVQGRKVEPKFTREGQQLILYRNQLAPGTYFLWLRQANRLIGRGSLIIGE